MIFEIRDSSGRMIRLTEKQFAHIAKHRMLFNKIEQIKEAVIHPHFIITSPRDKKVRYCFRFNKDVKLFLLAIIKYLNGDGFVITAYFTHKRNI